MKLIKSKESVAVVSSEYIESLCSSCAYKGQPSCPEKHQYSSFDEGKYPFINEYHLSGIYLLVDDCTYYQRKIKRPKQIVTRSEYVFDRQTRSFKKAK